MAPPIHEGVYPVGREVPAPSAAGRLQEKSEGVLVDGTFDEQPEGEGASTDFSTAIYDTRR